MVHVVPVVEDAPLLHLHKGDVLLVDLDAPDQVMLYRPLPLTYATLIPALVAAGVVTSTLTGDSLASLGALTEPPAGIPALAARSNEDRRHHHLKLLAGE